MTRIGTLWVGLLIFGLVLATTQPVHAAQPFYVELEANQSLIQGEPLNCPPTGPCTVGGEDISNLIEGFSFDYKVTRVTSGPGTRVLSGEIRIVKRVDKATPLLHQALAQNREIDAELRFYRNNPSSGVVERFHTITISSGRITGIAPWLTTGVGGGSEADPFLEAITFSFPLLRFTSDTSALEFEYSFQSNR